MRDLARRAAWSASIRLGLQVYDVCEKTDELTETTGLAPVVSVHRRESP